MVKVRRIISSGVIIKFTIKLIIKEKTYLAINIFSLLLSAAFLTYFLTINNNEKLVIMFDYYALFYLFILMFMLCLRLVFFIFINKRDDKTLQIIISHQVKRTKLFLFQIITILILVTINIIINYLLINTIYSLIRWDINFVLLRISSVYFFYVFISCIFLINFFLLMSLIAGQQFLAIIATFILSLSFISNLPLQFLLKDIENKNITMRSNNYGQTTMKVNEMYDSYNLRNHALNKKNKYPNLSYDIFNFFIESSFRTSTFEENKNKELRINFLKSKGIVVEKPVAVELKTPTRMATAYSRSLLSPWVGSNVTFKTSLKYRFLSIEELKEKYPDDLFIKEFIEFTNYINSIYANFQSQFYSLFEHFIILDNNNIATSYIKNEQTGQSLIFDPEYLIDIYQNYFNLNQNKLSLDKTTALDVLITETINFPTMLSVRILEDYFLRYTSNLVILDDSVIITTSADWEDYKNVTSLYGGFFHANLISNMLLNYSYYGGRAFDEIWFEPDSTSKIFFNKQNNLFISHIFYTFKLDSTYKITYDTYNNYLEPYFYILVQIVICTVNFFIARRKFNRMDLA
ncbi:hypothetical protein [Spiroplasma floricola]|uniref:ABC transporter permease n=1 Tax=Spiroplasma floricola 23-6 TaxID=1336749 RepID=A0A2K8SDP4_9MOLU|nr:hypothetical protein [Spiroplasma floricola]AUB31571.1 ABC transporter permease [Spiroplasma floricola 23-6]